MLGSLSADSNGTGAACTTFYLLHFAMQHDRHPVMQASTTRHIVRARNADSKMRSDACTWHRHDFTKSLWQPAAWTNPSVLMAGSWDMVNGPLGHQSRGILQAAMSKAAVRLWVRHLPANLSSLGLPRETRGNNNFLLIHSSFLCRCIFYWFLFSFLLNSPNSCHTHAFHCCCLRACYCHFTAVHDLPPAVGYDTHTKN